ncbi:VSP [Hexamita inflata]|uniref:VSP n=1 Tax=Hexamita inflata TaxID=28002 RepID=A0AA86U395_9EUKA|nr:VSP [Hexamita inflata]
MLLSSICLQIITNSAINQEDNEIKSLSANKVCGPYLVNVGDECRNDCGPGQIKKDDDAMQSKYKCICLDGLSSQVRSPVLNPPLPPYGCRCPIEGLSVQQVDGTCTNSTDASGRICIANGSYFQVIDNIPFCSCINFMSSDGTTCVDKCANDEYMFFNKCIKGDCPSGFFVDLSRRYCIEKTKCWADSMIPDGSGKAYTTIVGGKCVCSNSKWVVSANNKTCVPACTEVSQTNISGICVCNPKTFDLPTDANPFCTCEGKQKYNRQCYDSCPEGKFMNVTKNGCADECPKTQYEDKTLKICSCKPGLWDKFCKCMPNEFNATRSDITEGGICVEICPLGLFGKLNPVQGLPGECTANEVCSPGLVNLVNGSCGFKCDGFVLNDEQCVPKCPKNFVSLYGRCLDSCGADQNSDTSFVLSLNGQTQQLIPQCVCNSGFIQLDLTCSDKCGENQVNDGFRCMCASGYVLLGTNCLALPSSQCNSVIKVGYDSYQCKLCEYPSGLHLLSNGQYECRSCGGDANVFVERSTLHCITTCTYLNQSSFYCESAADLVNCAYKQAQNDQFLCSKDECNWDTQTVNASFCIPKCPIEQFGQNNKCAAACDSATYTLINSSNICSNPQQCVEPNGLNKRDTQKECAKCLQFLEVKTRNCVETCQYTNKTICEDPTDTIRCPKTRAVPTGGFECIVACDPKESDISNVCSVKQTNMSIIYIAAGAGGGVLVIIIGIVVGVCVHKKKNASKGGNDNEVIMMGKHKGKAQKKKQTKVSKPKINK